MQKVADYYDISIDSLKRRGHRHAENLPRNILIYLAVCYSGYEYKAIADQIGGLSRSAVTKIKMRMDQRLESNKELLRELKKLRATISMSNVPT